MPAQLQGRRRDQRPVGRGVARALFVTRGKVEAHRGESFRQGEIDAERCALRVQQLRVRPVPSKAPGCRDRQWSRCQRAARRRSSDTGWCERRSATQSCGRAIDGVTGVTAFAHRHDHRRESKLVVDVPRELASFEPIQRMSVGDGAVMLVDQRTPIPGRSKAP